MSMARLVSLCCGLSWGQMVEDANDVYICVSLQFEGVRLGCSAQMRAFLLLAYTTTL